MHCQLLKNFSWSNQRYYYIAPFFLSFFLSYFSFFLLSFSRAGSGAVWKTSWPSWVPVPNKPMVYVDVKQHDSDHLLLEWPRRCSGACAVYLMPEWPAVDPLRDVASGSCLMIESSGPEVAVLDFPVPKRWSLSVDELFFFSVPFDQKLHRPISLGSPANIGLTSQCSSIQAPWTSSFSSVSWVHWSQ